MLAAAGVALLIAGPWYLRNARLTGNPLYPADVTVGGMTIFAGMMSVARSHLLETPRGAWDVFVAGYYGLTRPVALVLIAGWVGAVVVVVIGTVMARRGRRRDRRDLPAAAEDAAGIADPRADAEAVGDVRSRARPRPRTLTLADPLARTCVIGPPVGIAIFVFTAPYGEMRFAYPSVALLFACLAVALRPLPRAAQLAIATAAALLAAFTAFHPSVAPRFVAFGAAAALPAMAVALAPRRTAKRIGFALGGVATVALAMYAYVNWEAYVRQTEADSAVAWADPGVYGAIGELWHFVRTDPALSGAPPAASGAGAGDGAGGGASAAGSVGPGGGATIAYANTFFTYPLMGYRYEHRVVHVPTRRDVERFRDLPRLPRKVTGEELVPAVCAEQRKSPDPEAWLRRLRESGAQYLVVAKYDPAAPTRPLVAPEMTFALQDARRFVRVFDNAAGSVFRIVW
jgi:hypothetical protein